VQGGAEPLEPRWVALHELIVEDDRAPDALGDREAQERCQLVPGAGGQGVHRPLATAGRDVLHTEMRVHVEVAVAALGELAEPSGDVAPQRPAEMLRARGFSVLQRVAKKLPALGIQL
jgi:hypothetical protein